MAPKSKYLFIASMDVDPAKEALFHEVYNTEHCPELGEIAGVSAITRYEAQAFQVLIGGQIQTVSPDGQPRFHAMYEIESPEILSSPEWVKQWNWAAGRNRSGPIRPTAGTPCCG